MKNVRGMIAFLIALFCGLIAAKMTSKYLRELQTPQPPQPDIEMQDIAPMAPGQDKPFTQSIPQGMRALSIPVDEVTGVSREVNKGDIVDVVAVSKASAECKNKDGRIARVILQGIEVLAAAAQQEEEDKPALQVTKKEKKWVATLLVKAEEAPLLAAADASADLRLVVRNPSDDIALQEPLARGFDKKQGSYVHRDQRQIPPVDMKKLVRPGMRAFTLITELEDGVSGRLQPGDRVDVILTCPFGHFSAKGHEAGAEGTITSTHMASRIFLQDIEVLAVDENERLVMPPKLSNDNLNDVMPTENAAVTEVVRSVVLHLSPEDAELLAVAHDATEKSVIRLVLRHPEDAGIVKTDGQLLIELLTEKKEYSNVEVIRGIEQTAKKFFKYKKGAIATRSEALFNLPDVDDRDGNE